MKPYLELMNKFDDGDHITDRELDVLLAQVKHACNELDVLQYPAYRLVVKDLIRRASTLEEYKQARKRHKEEVVRSTVSA